MATRQTIYVRTKKGEVELKERHGKLSAVLNGILMLVNGQRTREDLVSVAIRLGAPLDSIDSLVASELIEPMMPTGFTRPAALFSDRMPLESDFAPMPSVPFPDASQVPDSERHAQLYQLLINAARKHLGLTGFMFHLQVEKAGNLSELRKLVSPLSDAIARAKGDKVATAFLQRANVL